MFPGLGLLGNKETFQSRNLNLRACQHQGCNTRENDAECISAFPCTNSGPQMQLRWHKHDYAWKIMKSKVQEWQPTTQTHSEITQTVGGEKVAYSAVITT